MKLSLHTRLKDIARVMTTTSWCTRTSRRANSEFSWLTLNSPRWSFLLTKFFASARASPGWSAWSYSSIIQPVLERRSTVPTTTIGGIVLFSVVPSRSILKISFIRDTTKSLFSLSKQLLKSDNERILRLRSSRNRLSIHIPSASSTRQPTEHRKTRSTLWM